MTIDEIINLKIKAFELAINAKPHVPNQTYWEVYLAIWNSLKATQPNEV